MLKSELHSLGLNPDPAINSHPGDLRVGQGIIVCAVPRMEFKLCISSASISWWMLKDPTLSFANSRRAIAGPLNKFQTPALTYRGHRVNTAMLPEIHTKFVNFESTTSGIIILCSHHKQTVSKTIVVQKCN